MTRFAVAVPLLVLAGGCTDKNGNIIPPESNQEPVCHVQASGPGYEIVPGCVTSANYSNASGKTAVTSSASGTFLRLNAGGTIIITIEIDVPGAVHTGTYSASTSGMTGSISITNGTSTFLTTTNTGSNQGTFTLTVTKVSVLTNTANGVAYAIDGSIDATAPAVASSGATGTSTVHMTFTNN